MSASARWLQRTLDRLLPADVADRSELERLRARLVVGSSVSIGCIAVPYIGLFGLGFGAPGSAATMLVTSIGFLSTPLVLARTGSKLFATRWFLGFVAGALLLLSALDGGTGTAIFAFPLLPLVAAVTADTREAIGWAVASVGVVVGLLLARLGGAPFPQEISAAHHVLYEPAVAIGLVLATCAPAVLHRALADRALAEVERKHREIAAIVDTVADGIASLDAHGRVLAANAAAERLLGHGLAGRSLTDALALDGDLSRGLRSARVRRPDGGQAELEVAFERIPEVEPARWVATVHDVTAHNEAARAVAARDRAIEATRAKSGFLANMSHELRTPLNAIVGYGEILLEELPPGPAVADVHKILGAGRHLLALVNDVLDLAKIESGRLELRTERVEVGPLVAAIVETVRPIAAQNDDTLEVELDPDADTVDADPVRLRQALLNLASNAAKFTRGGRISIRTRRVGREVLFEVEDTGIGIPSDRLELVFDEFVQADASTTRRFGGTGLGLAITRRLCRMMGGDVVAHSEVGRGSTFTVRLPSSGPVPAREEDPSAPLVLVVDDDADARNLLERALREGGFRVALANDGPTALALARELRPVAVTLDVVMPGMDGWQVLAAMQAEPGLATVPVVLVTMVEDRSMGFALGATHYLAKPLDRDVLLQVLAPYRGTEHPTVLVVEDDGALRELLQRTLERAGYVVVPAEHGKVALDALQRVWPSVVVLDLMMPVMDGFEFLATIRRDARWQHLPVIVLTARDLTVEERAHLQLHTQRVLQKAALPRPAMLAHVVDTVAGLAPSASSRGGRRPAS